MPKSIASQADPFLLYELSVQCPKTEVDFVSRCFQRITGRKACLLREDFCGTAAVCCEWVKRHKENRAIGIDLNAETLDWARRRHLQQMDANIASRVTLRQDDVRTPKVSAVDIVSAMNFSYWCFRSRNGLRNYFSSVFGSLKKDGVLFLDAFGGYDAFREMTEERRINEAGQRFTYIWDQARYDPVDGSLTCHIHFAFPDGSRLDRAFSYHWRLWTLPELEELLDEAGFRRITVYWQGWDETGDADGIFKPVTTADADAGWICYLSAEK